MRRIEMTPRRIFYALFFLALALRVVFLLAFDNVFTHEGESYSKINLVQTWLQQGKPYPDPNFGPLHYWLIYLLFQVCGPALGWIWPVRLFALLLGALTVPLFYLLVAEAFDRRTAWAAAVLFACYPSHLRASPTGLAETPYLFFFTAGLLGFWLALKHRRGEKWFYLCLGALGIAAAGMLRFEAWLFLPVLCLLMLKRGWAMALLFGALSAIFPLWHMAMCCRIAGGECWHNQCRADAAGACALYVEGAPLPEKAGECFLNGEGECAFQPQSAYQNERQQPTVGSFFRKSGCCLRRGYFTSFAHTSATSFLQYMPNLPLKEKALGWFRSTGIGLGIPVALLALGGLILALRRRQKLAFAALFLAPALIMQYKALTNTMDPSLERYTMSLGMLLTPYAALVLLAVGDRLARGGFRHAATAALAALVVFNFAWAWCFATINRYDPDIRHTVRWLKENARPTDRVLPDQRFHPYVQLESGLPLSSFVSLEWSADRKSLNREAFDRLMTKTPPTVIVLDYFHLEEEGENMVNSNLDVFRNIGQGQERFTVPAYGLRYERALADGHFVVYRLAAGENSP